jgi:hypothetical protein
LEEEKSNQKKKGFGKRPKGKSKKETKKNKELEDIKNRRK